MDNLLKDEINEFVFRRAIERSPVDKDTEYYEEYEENSGKCIKLFEDIQKLLPEKSKKLINEYEETEHYCFALEIDQAYKRGFKDSFNLLLKMIN
jgi:hypothetical protein